MKSRTHGFLMAGFWLFCSCSQSDDSLGEDFGGFDDRTDNGEYSMGFIGCSMAENVDVDVSDILTDGADLGAAGERVWQRVMKVASGALTSCEVLGEEQLSVSRFGPSV